MTIIDASSELTTLAEGYSDCGKIDLKRMMLQDRSRFLRYMALMRAMMSAVGSFRTEFPDDWIKS